MITGIVLLHGLGSDHHEPLDLLSPILPDGTPVLAPDMRAHGESHLIGSASDFTIDALADETIETIKGWMDHLPTDERGGQHLVIAGISMGALLALRIASTGTLPVDRVAYIRPAFTDRSMPDNLEPLQSIAELLNTMDPEGGEQAFRASDIFRRILDASPLAADSLVSQFRAPDAVRRSVRLREIPRNVAFPQDFVAPPQQALIVSSAGDPIHPTRVADMWANRLPRATRVRVPNRDDDLALFTDGIRRCVRGWLMD